MLNKIKIAIDVRDLQKAFSGTKTYLESLILALNENKPSEFEYIFLDDLSPVYTGNLKWRKALEQASFFFWKQLRLPYLVRKHKCNLLFCSDYFLPFFQPGFRSVVVFHDAFFFEYPDHYNKLWLWSFKKLAIPAARKAAAIIVPSHYSKERILHFTAFEASKVKVIYEAPAYSELTIQESISNEKLKNLISKKYLLHVGTLNKNKNLVRLIHAFGILRNKKPDAYIYLVLAGKASTHLALNDEKNILEAIEISGQKDNIILTGYLNEEDLIHAYKNALLYIFPSFNEGFGIPVLEAFKFGIPVLAANNSCLPEIAGEAAVYFDPFDENKMAESIQLAYQNKELREEMTSKGTIRLEAFSWKKTAIEINELFHQITEKE